LKQKVFILYIIIYKVGSINKYLHFLNLGLLSRLGGAEKAERIIHPTSKERWLSDSEGLVKAGHIFILIVIVENILFVYNNKRQIIEF